MTATKRTDFAATGHCPVLVCCLHPGAAILFGKMSLRLAGMAAGAVRLGSVNATIGEAI